MPAEDIVTAYSVAVPHKQKQDLPGFDKPMSPGLEYSKLGSWDDDGGLQNLGREPHAGVWKVEYPCQQCFKTDNLQKLEEIDRSQIWKVPSARTSSKCLPLQNTRSRTSNAVQASSAPPPLPRIEVLLVQFYKGRHCFLYALACHSACGTRVNGIVPGPVITALQAGPRGVEEMKGLGVGLPLHGRVGQPAELGPAYVFLASSDSNIMTGQVLHLNCKFAHLRGMVKANAVTSSEGSHRWILRGTFVYEMNTTLKQ